MATGVLYKVEASTGVASPVDLGGVAITGSDGLVRCVQATYPRAVTLPKQTLTLKSHKVYVSNRQAGRNGMCTPLLYSKISTESSGISIWFVSVNFILSAFTILSLAVHRTGEQHPRCSSRRVRLNLILSR